MWVLFKEIIGAEKMDQVDKSAYLHKNDSLYPNLQNPQKMFKYL